jgi:hypothetical protein
MIDAQVTDQGLEVVVTGGDAWLLALRGRWEIVVPLEHVVRANVGKPLGSAVRRHQSGKGTIMVCAHRRAPNVVIDLDGDPYIRMTLSVPDPGDTAAAIKGALRPRA